VLHVRVPLFASAFSIVGCQFVLGIEDREHGPYAPQDAGSDQDIPSDVALPLDASQLPDVSLADGPAGKSDADALNTPDYDWAARLAHGVSAFT
jgi:hypothetical protein